MPLYYFTCDMGCGIREADSIKTARESILREVGTANGLSEVREATKEDVVWVKGMCGHIPKINY